MFGTLWFIVWIHLLIGIKLWWDHRARVRDKRIINHFRSALIDGILYAVGAYFCFGLQWVSGVWLLMAVVYRGLVFDLLYNLIFNNKWSYCGDSSKIDQWSDKLDGEDDQDCTLGFIIKLTLVLIGILLITLL